MERSFQKQWLGTLNHNQRTELKLKLTDPDHCNFYHPYRTFTYELMMVPKIQDKNLVGTQVCNFNRMRATVEVSSNRNSQNPFRLIQIKNISSEHYEIRLKWWILTPLIRKRKVFLRQSIISGFITLLFVTQPPSSV